MTYNLMDNDDGKLNDYRAQQLTLRLGTAADPRRRYWQRRRGI